MATYIQTNDVANTAQVPSSPEAGTLIRDAQWGIDATLSGYIIQNVQVAKTRVYDETYDQKNSLVSELDTDEQWTASMTVIGGDGNEDATIPGIEVGMTDFEWNNHKWKVRDVTYNGAYNDKKSYTVSLFRSTNFPAQD